MAIFNSKQLNYQRVIVIVLDHMGMSKIPCWDSCKFLPLLHCRIDSVDVSGKRVFIRVDFNVPQDKKDHICFEGFDLWMANQS